MVTRRHGSSRQDASGFTGMLPLRLSIAAVAVAMPVSTSMADDRSPSALPVLEAPRRDAEARPASAESPPPGLSSTSTGEGSRARLEGSGSATPRALPRFVGTASPGLRITLDGSGSTGHPRWYRWVQVQGPSASLDRDDGPVATLTVPGGSGPLAFILLVGNGEGADAATMTVPVELKGRAAVGSRLRADAGDDQVAQAGRQVTLNGIRSAPRDGLGYRWIQVAGPRVSLKIEDAYVLTFVPPADGLYRFALVVASGSEISDPDYVDVAVGVPLPPPVDDPAAGPAPAPVALDALARASLTQVDGGVSAAEELGMAFEEVAARIDLYTSYAELMVELTRRLEGIVPADAARRSAWLRGVFAPLTARVIDRMRPEGLDLARPEGRSAEMTRPQRKVLAQQFRAIAGGFRTASAR